MIIVRFLILLSNILNFDTHLLSLKYITLKNKKKLFYWNITKLIAKINKYVNYSNVYFNIQYIIISVLFKCNSILYSIKNWLIFNKKLQTYTCLINNINFSIYKISYFLLFIDFCNE